MLLVLTYGDDSMVYEVEKRINRNLENNLPREAKLSRVFEHITDTYYVFPDPMLRIRYAILSFPEKKIIENVCMKKIDGENVEEYETSIGDSKSLGKMFNSVLGKPKVVAEGNRKEYSFRDTAINFDYVKKLGKWTEIEIKVPTIDEIIEASEEIDSIFGILGVDKKDLTQKTYPEMLYKKIQS